MRNMLSMKVNFSNACYIIRLITTKTLISGSAQIASNISGSFTSPSSSISSRITFLEGGASYNSFKDYNPFELYRSAGLGIRIFMPAFGLLGIDFGYGFDPLPGEINKHGWETHFIIGQQF